MPKKKKRLPSKQEKRISESYVSLILGILVVFIAAIFLTVFAKNRTYDRINTAISIFEQPSNFVELPEKESPKTYEVKPGDTLWSISEKVYGSGYNWVDLAKANKLRNPGIIEVGAKLVAPDVQKIVVAKATSTQSDQIVQPTQTNPITTSSYKVQQGDYLWDIAIRKYGDGYKWPQIASANQISNPDLIYANTTLKLP